MAKTLGFGVIGCGVIGKLHAKTISEIGGARLVALADVVPEKAKELAERYQTAWYDDYRELLNRSDVDIVNVCTPSGMHGDIAIEAANAGKHLIVEKPIDITLEKADQMIQTCKDAGVKLCVISQHRFDSSTIKVKKDIDENKMGTLFLGEAAVNWYRSQGYYDSGDWRGTWELDGGGALMNQSIHTIDLLQYLMGPVESVHAHVGTFNHERIEVEDAAAAVVKFKNGGIGTIVGATAAYPGLTARIEVFGTKGSAVIDSDELTHLYHMDEPIEGAKYKVEAVNLADRNSGSSVSAGSNPAAVENNAHKLQLLDMIDAVLHNREPFVNGEEGRKGLEIILAIYESARTGQTVKLPCKELV